MTLALVDTGALVTAVEVDHGLVRALRETTEGRALRIVEADALTLDWDTVLGTTRPWVLVANLPYNVATPLIGDLLDGVPAIERMVVMVQREVADRLVARAGADAYGAVSVKVAYWATATIVGKVPASVFLPQPKVESALVEITRRPVPAVDPSWVTTEELFALVRAGFGQRRKMLRRSLSGLVSADVFAAAGVRPEARAEELDVHEWGELARARRNSSP